jgi:large subunit ribosomal protein L18
MKTGDTQCSIFLSFSFFKVEAFLSCMEEGGVTLSEPPRFQPHRPWNLDRPEKPWEVTE